MGWVLTASGALAGPHELVGAYCAQPPQGREQRMERPEVVDPETAAVLKVSGGTAGAFQVTLTWTDLEVRKVVQPNGDFNARIAGREDLVVFVRTADRLRVTRDGRTATIRLSQPDEDGLDAVQQVLAGSRAVRLFRGLRERMSSESLESAPGVAIDNLDVLLGILQGEPGAVSRRAPGKDSGPGRVSRISSRVARTCYSEYEGEVVAAWDDFSQCIYDVRWFPGLQEVCAFAWLLRSESAWFRFLGCSSIPMRVA